MSYLRVARAAAGFLSVVALLVLVVGEFYLNRGIEPGRVALLVLLIGALLGVDLLREYLPVEITFTKPDGADDDNGSE